jgi:HD-like signal output (HDOD) protein
MIHDVGILISLQLSPEKLQQVCERVKASGEDFCTVEREIVGMDHQQLGAGLAEHWKFPRPCQLVAGNHHQPSALGDENRALVTLVYVADTLCCRASSGFNLTALKQSLDDSIVRELNIDDAMIERTAIKLPELVAAAATMVG